jgi:hypothetical protein
MNMKTALIGSFAAAAALVAVSADANARSWHYKRTACGPSATVIKHNRYGFVGGERDYGVRSRTFIRGERSEARFGVRGHERSGVNVNVNARFRGGEDRHGARVSGSERNMGAGAGAATGRSVSPSGTSNAGSSGGAASSGAGAKTGAGGGAGLGASGGASGGASSGGGAGAGGGGGGSR